MFSLLAKWISTFKVHISVVPESMVPRMNRSTQVTLVLLRLVIGWHFLFEGLHKIHSLYTPKPFSSEVYFREAPGPLGAIMRNRYITDPDKELKEKLVKTTTEAEWGDYLSSFSSHYQLDETQKKAAQTVLASQISKFSEWLISGKKDIEIPSPDGKPGGTIKTSFTIPQWIAYYQGKVSELDKLKEENRSWVLGKDLEKARISSLKSDISKSRKELLDDIETQKKDLVADLQKILKPEQKSIGDLKPEIIPSKIHWINLTTIFGITAIGAGLFLGCFTRLACLGGIAFLGMTYLTIPPFPWLPTPPMTEGNYVFINKNVVEMIGMLVLFTTQSGKWFGIDGLLAALLPCCAGKCKKD